MMEIQEKDRRKTNKTSRLGPVLAAIFNRIRNLQGLYGDGFLSMIKPYLRGEKRLVNDTDDEPPTQRSKLDKKKEQTLQDRETVIQDLIDVGYTIEEAMEAYNKHYAEQTLNTSFKPIPSTEQLPSSSRRKTVTIKFSKGKPKSKSQPDTESKFENPVRRSSASQFIPFSQAKSSCELLLSFVQQRFSESTINTRQEK